MKVFISLIFIYAISLNSMEIAEDQSKGVERQVHPTPPWIADKIFRGELSDRQIDEADCRALVKELEDRENFTGAGWVMSHLRPLAEQGAIKITYGKPLISLALISEPIFKAYLKEQSALIAKFKREHTTYE